jgi:cell division septation protein DedD
VTEPHEPSYYEIALTNRQVVVAFVILLACLLAAFFSGVWIGRGGIDLRRDQLVRATPPPAPSEGRTLEELKFFAERPGRRSAPAPTPPKPEEKRPEEKPAPAAPPAARPGTTLQQDIGSQGSPPARTAAVPSPSPVVRATPPAPVAPAPEDAEESAQLRPEPVQAKPAEKTARGKAPAAETPAAADTAAAGAGSVVIQVFASADPTEAQRVRERLGKGGQTAFVSPLTVDGRTMYRVRIGPFATRQKAQKVAEKVRKTFKLDTWLTE